MVYWLAFSTEIDHCKSEPCKNGGTCKSNKQGFSCKCQDAYFGPTCAEGCFILQHFNVLCEYTYKKRAKMRGRRLNEKCKRRDYDRWILSEMKIWIFANI